MKKISFFNNKGGVGKTTTAINVAYKLAETDFGSFPRKILVVDCDSQRNLYDFFADAECVQSNGEKFQKTRYPNIDLTVWSAEISKASDYDFVIFDLPPTFSGDVKTILCDSDYVFVPVEPNTFSVKGLTAVTNFIAETGVKPGGFFITKYDKNNSSNVSIGKIMQTALASGIMRTKIPFGRTIMNSLNYRLTAFEYMKRTNAVISLGELTEEILERTGE